MSGEQINLLDEIIVDNFAGGGGASTGIELATGRPVAIAINHDPDAILMHRTNHPYTEHLQASVWDVDPREVCRGRPVGLAWFSPDCKHFSKAKGAALVDRNIRGLAWIVLRWAGTVRPRVIILENVEEFVTWGPVRKGKPVKKKAGQTFQKWKRQLLELGYQVEHREIVAADLGAPTTRKRFVLVARCDGRPIVWPERTHGPRDSEEVRDGRLLPWKSAAEIIDWSVPCYSVFASKRELKEKYGVQIRGCLAQIGDISCEIKDWEQVEQNPFFCPDPSKLEALDELMRALKKEGDSIGAKVTVVAEKVPVGLGEPVFDRLDADLAHALMSINAVKGVEIGDGFAVVNKRGSENRDEITPEGFQSNHAGGILGGISSGQDIIAHLALKPTSSIMVPGKTINRQGEAVEMVTRGRHDPCVGIRAVPIAEAMMAIVLMDHLLRQRAQCGVVVSDVPRW